MVCDCLHDPAAAAAACLQVVFGGGTHSALGVALLRTGGIITGVLLFMGLTVVILPKSATIEALRCEGHCSRGRQVSGLHATGWFSGHVFWYMPVARLC